MTIVSSYIDRDRVLAGGSREIHEYHVSASGKTRRFIYTAPAEFDVNAQMLARVAQVETDLAAEEVSIAVDAARRGVNPDRVPLEQTQIEFDRRLLAALMQEADIRTLIAGYDFFLAQETRNGNNNIARAAALGVPKNEYDLVDARFSVMAGINGVLIADRDRVWGGVPSVAWS